MSLEPNLSSFDQHIGRSLTPILLVNFRTYLLIDIHFQVFLKSLFTLPFMIHSQIVPSSLSKCMLRASYHVYVSSWQFSDTVI